MSVIKLRGLPWSCTVQDIIQFLEPIKVVYKSKINDLKYPSEINDISAQLEPAVFITLNDQGRPSGEAFIELEDEKSIDSALTKNNNLIGQRYIEVFRSSKDQLMKHAQDTLNRTSNWCQPVVRLRGLPFEVTIMEVMNFFNGKTIYFFVF
jgi:heterogeneous nuclear ribonucleoprotein F/H